MASVCDSGQNCGRGKTVLDGDEIDTPTRAVIAMALMNECMPMVFSRFYKMEKQALSRSKNLVFAGRIS